MGRGDEHLDRAGFRSSRIWAKQDLSRAGFGPSKIWAEQDLDQVRCGSNRIWAEVVSLFLKRRDLISNEKIEICY